MSSTAKVFNRKDGSSENPFLHVLRVFRGEKVFSETSEFGIIQADTKLRNPLIFKAAITADDSRQQY